MRGRTRRTCSGVRGAIVTVRAIDGRLERPNCIEWALKSWSGGIRQVGIGYSTYARSQLRPDHASNVERQECRGKKRTNDIPILVLMLHMSQRAQIGLLQSDSHCSSISLPSAQDGWGVRPRGPTWEGNWTYWVATHSWRPADQLWCVDCVCPSPQTIQTDETCGQRCRSDGIVRI